MKIRSLFLVAGVLILINSCSKKGIEAYKYKCRYEYDDKNIDAIHCGKFYIENETDINMLFNFDTLILVSNPNKEIDDSLKINDHFIVIHFQHKFFRLVDSWLDSIYWENEELGYYTRYFENDSYRGECFINESNQTINLHNLWKQGYFVRDNDTINTSDSVDLIPYEDTLSYSVKLLEYDKKGYYKRVELIKQKN